jgi:glycosyltransferase involved in cell wall biosynthesis
VLEKVDGLGIVKAVLELRENEELSQRLGQGAVAFARKYFNWEKNTSELSAFYDRIAAVRPREHDDVPATTSS